MSLGYTDGVRYFYKNIHSVEPVNPIVLIHGVGTSLDFWHGVAPALADIRPVYALDLPGSGRSRFGGPTYDLDGVAEETLQALERLGLRHVTLVGHSLGALVTLQMAVRSPDVIRHLVLVDPVLYSVESILTDIRAAARNPVLLAHTIAQFASGLVPGWAAARAMRVGLVRRLAFAPHVTNPNEIDPVLAAAAMRNIGGYRTLRPVRIMCAARSVDVSGKFESLDVPTSIVYGSEDPLLPRADIERVSQVPSVREVLEIPNCGHLPMLERPQELVDALAYLMRGEDL